MGEGPADVPTPARRWRKGGKLAVAIANALVIALFGAFLAGLLAPFLGWLYEVAGVAASLLFMGGFALSLTLLVFYGLTAPPLPSAQSATVESLQMRQI
jgi:hypothetical protein